MKTLDWLLSGKPRAIPEPHRDVPEQRKSNGMFEKLLESAWDAMVIVNREGLIQIVNARTEKLFGYKREELLGQPVEILVPHRFQARHAVHRRNYFHSPRQREMGAGLELYGMRKDGTEFPVEISLSPLETEEGMLVSSAIRDISDHKKTQADIQKLNQQLNQRVSELNTANKELESFSYSVSHDLRAPLRHIDGFAHILREKHAAELSDDGKRYLDRILQAADRMGRLVEDLLTLSRIGREQLAIRRVNLSDLVREAVSDLSPNSHGRNIEWKIEPLPEVECDPGLMRLVLSNLLSNAAKFTRGRKPAIIEIGSRTADGRTAFFVRDNGVGFDPKYADRLFGVFQRLHRAEEFEGTGIGLATAQRVISRHGGEIWAESKPDCGATFYFTLGSQPVPPMPGATIEVGSGEI